MFNRLRTAITKISYPYECITQSITIINGKSDWINPILINAYGNVQNIADGSMIFNNRDQAQVKQSIIFLTPTYLKAIGNPVYNNGTQTRVIIIYKNHYYRLMLQGGVQDGIDQEINTGNYLSTPNGYLNTPYGLLSVTNGIKARYYRESSYYRYHGELLTVLSDIETLNKFMNRGEK